MDNTTGRNHLEQYLYDLNDLINTIDPKQIAYIGDILYTARVQKKNIFCIGNGGSAATSSHFATDLSWGRNNNGDDRPKAISLTSNTSIVTALSNDIGYDEVFSQQLQTFLNPGDIIFAISASGNSPNIVKAIEYGNSKGGITIGLIGFDGGKMKTICQEYVHVRTVNGSYELVEDVHHSICHMLSTYIRQL